MDIALCNLLDTLPRQQESHWGRIVCLLALIGQVKHSLPRLGGTQEALELLAQG